MFNDKSGSKISKSAGNSLTPQVWYRYGSRQSLSLLCYKRMAGSRNLDVEDIPVYMKEVDYLENVYFGKIKEGNQARKRKLKGLYEYCWYLKPPENPSIQVPYTLLVNLVSVSPDDKAKRKEFLESRLREYGYLRDGTNFEDIEDRIRYAENWVTDFSQMEEVKIELNDLQIEALNALVKVLETAETADDIQAAIFETSRAKDIKPRDFFTLLYRILLNTDRGPKLGPYIHTIGIKQAIKSIEKNLP
jgi:lysyl-tRNA synthetase class 1